MTTTMTPVRTQPATRTSNQPLGGNSGRWSYRLLRYHLPLALASVVATFLWMSLPVFRQPGAMGAAQHGAQQAAGHQMPPQAAQAAGHGRSPQAAQAAAHAGPAQQAGASTSMDHGAAQGGNQSRDATADLGGEFALLQSRGVLARFTTATGYVALVLLAATLLIGPANLLRRRRNPISSYLRRDVGTWTAIVSVIHVIVGFQVHGPPVDLGRRILRYFFAPDGSVLTDSFGLGNWTGLAATVIVVGLLALSNDAALRKFKAGRWKWLQRLNYALFALVVAHAIYYGALTRVASVATLVLGLSTVAVFVGQLVGVWLWRRRYARAVVQPV